MTKTLEDAIAEKKRVAEAATRGIHGVEDLSDLIPKAKTPAEIWAHWHASAKRNGRGRAEGASRSD